MNLVAFLLKTSWRMVLLASLMGGASGAASIALIAMIHQTLRQPNATSTTLVALFAICCLIVLLTQIASQLLLKRLSQDSMSRIRLQLCRRILDSPLARLEEIGDHRMLASLTGDVGTVTQAMDGVPVLCVNIIILLCGFAYLGWLSATLLLGTIVMCVLGVASYQYSAVFARRYIRRGREAQDGLLKQIRSMTQGLKELKMHHDRRRVFVDEVLTSANDQVCRNLFIGYSIQDAAIILGRLFFFLAIGLLLFAWPAFRSVDTAMLTGYTITILYLMAPLERVMAYLPLMQRANVSVEKIKRLGLMLDDATRESPVVRPIPNWQRIELAGVTHSYQRPGDEHGFLLGPIDLTFQPGEIVFLVGGNGSGKTTLLKLVTGLYLPEDGEVRLDEQAVTAANRESYRQLFSVVFDDAVLFDSLMGLSATHLDRRARDYLRELELDHVVTVDDGVFSSTRLSRGQRKRLALLTAYLEDRPIYVFDEWAADQDPQFKKLFYQQILPELKRRGKAVIAITHDDRYFTAADRVVKLEDGKISRASGEATQPTVLLSCKWGEP